MIVRHLNTSKHSAWNDRGVVHAGAHVPCSVLPQPASVVAGRCRRRGRDRTSRGTHSSASTTVGGEGKAFCASILMYIPRTLTTLTLPEL